MAIRVALTHKTTYSYDRLVHLGPQIVRLRPAPHCRTPVLSYSLKVQPQGHFLNWQQDPQSNYLARLVFPEPTRQLHVEVDLVAELTVINPFDFFVEAYADNFPFEYEHWLDREIAPYRELQPAGPLLSELLASIDRTPQNTVDFLVALNQRLQHEIKYVIRLEPGIQSCEETLERRQGSCRDSAWLLVQVLRHLGFAARFVSGYLIQLKPDVKPLEGPAGTDHDFTDLHAWTEVYLPGAGWIGFDPTSGLLAGEGHLPLACTPDPSSAAPITGSVEACETQFEFSMSIARIYEDPRVTQPYTDEQWQRIDALGHRVDEVLRAADVRLTMGGEPTFVSIDDMQGDEWNTAAVGPTKRLLAGDLLRRMANRHAPGGLYHFGQGKWYPGEELPRWALSVYWRRDGQPIWENPRLFADERVNYGHDWPDARRFTRALCERLQFDPARAIPGYEDPWYYLWRERRLPTNVDPLESNLENPQERKRLARIFEQGLGKIVGYCLPIERAFTQDGWQWQTGRWFFRQEHLFLVPGDSPMGYRLPLDSLPWVPPEARPVFAEADRFTVSEPLPDRAPKMRQRRVYPTAGNGSTPRSVERALSLAAQRAGNGGGSGWGPVAAEVGLGDWEPHETRDHWVAPAWDTSPSIPGLVRTAMCIEPRDGRLHIFMPPLRTAEDYLDLVAALEDTAESLRTPVVIEGYHPPFDPRLNHFRITPDPGVIEVNMHPSNDWPELVELTTGLYEDARECRLGTEKFMLDGRHTGTGGGNHIVLGGTTPADSPILRRPDLLRSLVSYWHNHPSLSYLFSGLFVGPTSQSPRVDEARHDALYELEIAFAQVPRNEPCPPWLVDRLFRHLLTDVTGNTHRSEFCIDKLYSPDTADGRRGLVEFRAFEMPPHPRMSLTQQLLLRSLVARFWNAPYEKPLVRWGTGLHDRYLLPHFVWQDFEDVISETNSGGFPLEAHWFAPHFEFRFPLIGRVAQRGIELELRNAIEPWNVLGEEPAGGSTARYVDSSVERLEVKVRGLIDTRHLVTCNGRPVPLHPTGTVGEFVAGVRYRAWQPPTCLHPTIPVHTPLVFDLVDTWLDRSLGGCTYYVAHPGGRHYEHFPVNAFEAESRRGARFYPIGHTSGRLHVEPATDNPQFPFTLDLRKG